VADITLRTFVFLDSMQPQFASFVATTSRGYLPIAHEASVFIEIAPGIAINRATDVALKANDVRPGMQIVERAFGLLEIHGPSPAEVLSSGTAALEEMGLTINDRMKPKIMSSQIITNVSDYQAQLINRMRYGHMLLGGESLYILEVEPAAYTALAANEAEKNADIKLLEMRVSGAFGRLYLGGEESSIQEAVLAVDSALSNVTGRETT
jgi:ethanolamine utilization microcompartment shell protein EutS